MLKEFKEFIARGNVIDMAVGIIMGAAFTTIVTSMVGDIIMPIISVLTSDVDFANKYFVLNGAEYETLKAAKDAGAPVLTYGAFLNAVLNFFIISVVVFFLVKGVNNFRKRIEDPKEKDTPPPPRDIVLLAEIRDLLAKQNK